MPEGILWILISHWCLKIHIEKIIEITANIKGWWGRKSIQSCRVIDGATTIPSHKQIYIHDLEKLRQLRCSVSLLWSPIHVIIGCSQRLIPQWTAFNLIKRDKHQTLSAKILLSYGSACRTEKIETNSIAKDKHTFVRFICLKANTASALKSTPGPSSNEKTILV